MEISNSQKSSTVSGLSGDAAFSANIDGIAFQTLIGNLYKDKPRAVVRETVSNCRDANTWRDQLYGNITAERIAEGSLTAVELEHYNKLKSEGYADPQTPYKIHIPTSLEPYLEFEDFGIGLTVDEAIGPVDKTASEIAGRVIRKGGFLNTMFNSSKRGENVSIGGFGLGCKCPLSIVDTFTYRVIKGGEEHQFIVFFTKDGIPDVNWLTRDEDFNPAPIKTDRENGVIVTLDTVAGSLFEYIKTCVSDILQTFPQDEQPVINEGEYVFKSMETTNLTDSIYIVDKFHYGNLFHNKYLVECGGVVYPIDGTKMVDVFDSEMVRMLSSASNGNAIVVRMGLGTVKVPPSREEISYDDTTIKNIAEKFSVAYEILQKNCEQIVEDINFKDPDNIKKSFRRLTNYYEDLTTVYKMINKRLEKVLQTEEYTNYHITLKLKESNRSYYNNYDNLSVSTSYFCPILQKYSNDLITTSDRFNVEKNSRNKTYIKKKSKLINSSIWDKKTDRSFVYLEDIPKKSMLLSGLDSTEFDIVRFLSKIQRSYMSIKPNLHKMIDGIDKDFLKTVERINNEVDNVVYSVKAKDEVVKDITNHNKYTKIVGLVENKEFQGPPTKKAHQSSIKHKSIIESLDPNYQYELYNSLRGILTLSGSDFIEVDCCDVLERLETLKKKAKKYATKAPKSSEIQRNISYVDVNQHAREGDVKFVERWLSDSSSFSYSNKVAKNSNKRLQTIDVLENLLDSESPDNRTIYWISEEDFKANNNATNTGDFEIDSDMFKRFVEENLDNCNVLIVKGIRTISRRALENHPNAVMINFIDLIADLKEFEIEEFKNGRHSVFNNVSYHKSWRMGFNELYNHLLLGYVLRKRYSPRLLRFNLRKLRLFSKENPCFKQYLELYGYNIEELFETVSDFIRNEKYLMTKHDEFTGKRISTPRSYYGNSSVFYENSKELGLSNKKLSQLIRVVEEESSEHFCNNNNLKMEDFPKTMGFHVTSKTLDMVTQILRLFETNNLVKGDIIKAKDITQHQLDNLIPKELDVGKITSKFLKSIKSSFENFDYKLEKDSIIDIEYSLEKVIEHNILRSIKTQSNPFIVKEIDTSFNLRSYISIFGSYEYTLLEKMLAGKDND